MTPPNPGTTGERTDGHPAPLAWLAARGDGIASILGTERVARAEENTAADGVALDPDHIVRSNAPPAASGERHDETSMDVIDR